jgi:predicted dienelactone hydrolase
MRFLSIFLAVFFATAANAAGISRLTLPQDARGPKINAIMWTPCATAPAPLDLGTPLPLQGVKDCPIRGNRLPLVVISHGLGGAYFSHYDTAETLANNGVVVVALNHPFDSGLEGMKRADDIVAMVSRPQDVKRVIDYVLESSFAATRIDKSRIGFFGFSRGGYTGLVLAGATPDFRKTLLSCPDTVKMCAQVHRGEVPAAPPGQDSRIRAFIIADPLSAFPDRKSLDRVRVPVSLWSSALGGQGVDPASVAAIADNLGTKVEYHPVPNSTHLSFLFPCTPAIAKLDHEACTDPPGFDRAAFHKDFDAAALAFFRKNLSREHHERQ